MTVFTRESNHPPLVFETLALIPPNLRRLTDLSLQLVNISLSGLLHLDATDRSTVLAVAADKSELTKQFIDTFTNQFAITGPEIISQLIVLPPLSVSEFDTHSLQRIYQEQLLALQDIFPHQTPDIKISTGVNQDALCIIFGSGQKGHYLPSQEKIEISVVHCKDKAALLKTFTWWNGENGISMALWQKEAFPDPIDLSFLGLFQNFHRKLMGTKICGGEAQTSTDGQLLSVTLSPVQNSANPKKV